MANPFLIENSEEIGELLRKFPATSRKKGETLFKQGAVKQMKCVDPGSEYEALVQDEESCEVHLLLDPESGWHAECDCFSSGSCSHTYAAFKALLAEHSVAQVQSLSGGGGVSTPGASALQNFREKVSTALGRSLKKEEEEYLQLVRSAFRRCKDTGQISSFELQRLKLPPKEPAILLVRIAPFPLKSELEFWQCLALFASRQSIEIPPFLRAVTDTQAMEERFDLWERNQEIRSWRQRFFKLGRSLDAPSGAAPVVHELRLCVGDSHLQLDWRPPGMDFFTKPTHAELDRLAEQLNGGFATLTEASSLIWSTLVDRSAAVRQIEYYFYDTAVMGLVGRLIRLASLADSFVTHSGQALERPEEPLRWELTPPEARAGSYRLRLVGPGDQPAPKILRVFEGNPTLYLTADAVFRGPSKGRGPFDHQKEHLIPVAAVESSEGVTWAQSIGIALPASILTRLRPVPMQVKIRCSIVPLHLGSNVELCLFEVTAVSPASNLSEVWGREGWKEVGAEVGDLSDSSEPGGDITVPDRSALECIPALMEPLGGDWERYFGTLSLRITKKFPQLFSTWLESVPSHVDVQLEGELKGFADGTVSGRVRLDVTETDLDWFDLRVVLDISDTQLSENEIKLLLNARGGYVRLAGKGWKRLAFELSDEDDEQLARLGLSPKELSAEPQRMHVLQLSDPASKGFLKDDQMAQIQRRASELKARVTPALPDGIRAELRPYQLQGFHFLAYLTENSFGGILADDMGLGKTLQTLTWLVWLRQRAEGKEAKPSLVICPKSVMDNWRSEAAKFAGALRVKVWPASEVGEFARRTGEVDLHVLNYNQLRNLGEALGEISWQAIILDEGQYIKNPSSQTAQIARALKADQRLVLTGTPIENRLLDLWSLMAFAMPGMLGSRNQFGRLYDTKADPLARRRLSARVRPFLLRRTKAQVAKDLPDRIEEDLLCEMEGEQKVLYSAELKRAQQLLLRVKTQKELAKQQMHFLTSLLRLRQICCSPRLVAGDCREMGSKLEALLDQLEPLMEEGHKVLVFSQFVDMLKLIRQAVVEREWAHYYLAGETEDRGQLVEQFQGHEGAAVFLISLKAGGFGLNLTAASYVVLFDPWWNPAVENQAIDRTHRIGQTNNVMAYRLLIKGSVEEKIRVLQRRKSALAEDVLGEEKFSQSLTIDDLKFLFSDIG
ncbi:MAG: DEAD/DEAH box helicase [Verrucomicrobiales bacterium]|nr:DEAD/DEAH box helicase [Verrucomicrobiales bacterium]